MGDFRLEYLVGQHDEFPTHTVVIRDDGEHGYAATVEPPIPEHFPERDGKRIQRQELGLAIECTEPTVAIPVRLPRTKLDPGRAAHGISRLRIRPGEAGATIDADLTAAAIGSLIYGPNAVVRDR